MKHKTLMNSANPDEIESYSVTQQNQKEEYNFQALKKAKQRKRETVGAEGGASNGGELLAGVDVLQHRLVQPR